MKNKQLSLFKVDLLTYTIFKVDNFIQSPKFIEDFLFLEDFIVLFVETRIKNLVNEKESHICCRFEFMSVESLKIEFVHE